MITTGKSTYEEVVVFINEFYDRITDDNCPPVELFVMPESGYDAISGYVSGGLASMFIVHGEKMHYMAFKPYRKHSKELLRASFKRRPKAVYCEIPSLYMEVVNFAKNYGFKEINVERLSHRKNGHYYDVHTLTYEV